MRTLLFWLCFAGVFPCTAQRYFLSAAPLEWPDVYDGFLGKYRIVLKTSASKSEYWYTSAYIPVRLTEMHVDHQEEVKLTTPEGPAETFTLIHPAGTDSLRGYWQDSSGRKLPVALKKRPVPYGLHTASRIIKAGFSESEIFYIRSGISLVANTDNRIARRWYDTLNRVFPLPLLSGGADSAREAGAVMELMTGIMNGGKAASAGLYSFSLLFTVSLTPHFLCLGEVADSYWGGAHGFTHTRFATLDLRSYKILTYDDIFLPGYEKKLMSLLRRKLPADKQELKLSDEFYLTETGIGFYWNTYEYGTYAEGSGENFLTLNEIRPLLKPYNPWDVVVNGTYMPKLRKK